MIDLADGVHPLSDFKGRTTEFVQSLRESGRPMLLTLSRRPALVPVDACALQKLVDELEDGRSQLRAEKKKQGLQADSNATPFALSGGY